MADTKDTPKEPKKQNGGARPGAGMPKGYKTAKTLKKEEAREALRQIVMEHMRELVAGQIAQAKGLSYLVGRHKLTGQFTRLSKKEVEKILSGKPSDYNAIEVWQKDPSTPAFVTLMDRALDRPKEQEQEIVVHDGDKRAARLLAARQRSAKP